MSKAIHIKNISRAQDEIASKRASVKGAEMRQRYHFMAEEGWINDPNGLTFFRGKYHYFYQFNPYDSYWGAMHWGHAVSSDLLHWEYLPVALAPSELYDNHERGGCFSGTSIEHDGKLYLFYTGTAKQGDEFAQTQCMAYSEDGLCFEKYDNNPVIVAPPGYDQANFRDPKVWKHEDYYYMLCGAKKDNLAKALIYKSKDLLEWEFMNVLFESRGEYGYMFECPDFFPMDDKYVLMFSPMGLHERTAVYLVGDMDYKTGKFIPTSMGEIDWGFDFYAAQSFLDGAGRRIVVAWANAWDWMPWWKDWGPTYQEDWCGAYNIPREVRMMPNHTLQFVPIKELEELRGERQEYFDIKIQETPFSISGGDGVSFESKLVLDLERTTAKRILLKLRCKGGKESLICLDLQKAEMTFDRNNSDGWSTGCSRSPLSLKNKTTLDIHIFSDQSSIEVFSSNYQNNHSCNVFASSEQNQNFVMAQEGEAVFKSIVSWGINSCMDR